jgi:hypothetical protein
MNPKYPGFVLNGTITVARQLPPLLSSSSASSSSNFDTVMAFVVPLNMQDKLVSEFKSRGFGIDSTHVFNSVRGDGTEGYTWLRVNLNAIGLHFPTTKHSRYAGG